MSWLLFLDESGHDHRQMPYEVRGGVTLHASKVWSFVQAMQSAEHECFGCSLQDFGHELKGASLLKRDRFKHALSKTKRPISPQQRRNDCRSLFARKQRPKPEQGPRGTELPSYGQACLLMA